MRLHIRNSQQAARLAIPALRALIQRLATCAQARQPGTPPWQEITLHLLDDAGIAPVNQAVMGHAGDTDVITQRYDSLPGEPAGVVGEIFVNVERACRAAPRIRGWSADRELALYLAHGIDHLTGADDRTPAGRARMRRRELAWLRKLSLTALLRTDNIKR